MARFRLTACVVTLLALGACSTAATAVIEGGIKKAQDGFDNAGEILKAEVCAMSLGAFYRINSGAERAALATLCDPTQ